MISVSSGWSVTGSYRVISVPRGWSVMVRSCNIFTEY